MTTTRRSIFAAALAFGARCFGKAKWPTGGYVRGESLAKQHQGEGIPLSPEMRARLEASVAPLRPYRATYEPEVMTITFPVMVDGQKVEVAKFEPVTHEVKSVRHPESGALWKRYRVAAVKAHDVSGNVYWREGDGPWERV